MLSRLKEHIGKTEKIKATSHSIWKKIVIEDGRREEPFSVLSNVLINPFSTKLAYPLIK